jgi:hypothetical protein
MTIFGETSLQETCPVCSLRARKLQFSGVRVKARSRVRVKLRVTCRVSELCIMHYRTTPY